jgi:hypothetical protein
MNVNIQNLKINPHFYQKIKGFKAETPGFYLNQVLNFFSKLHTVHQQVKN